MPECFRCSADLGRRALALDNAPVRGARPVAARSSARCCGRRSPISPAPRSRRGTSCRRVQRGRGDFSLFATGAATGAGHRGRVRKGAGGRQLTASPATRCAPPPPYEAPRAVPASQQRCYAAPRYRFCTALYVSLTPRDGPWTRSATAATRCRSSAVDRDVETAGRPVHLLGIVDDPDLSEQRVALAGRLVYTRRRHRGDGGDRALGASRSNLPAPRCVARAQRRGGPSNAGRIPRTVCRATMSRGRGAALGVRAPNTTPDCGSPVFRIVGKRGVPALWLMLPPWSQRPSRTRHVATSSCRALTPPRLHATDRAATRTGARRRLVVADKIPSTDRDLNVHHAPPMRLRALRPAAPVLRVRRSRRALQQSFYA